MDSTPLRPCAPRARCHDYRRCPICARIRQAKIADAAERLTAQVGRLAWTCLQPDAPGIESLAAARAAFLRAEKPPGAIWTVEYTAETGNLHCNILSPLAPPREMRIAKVWHSPVTGDVRAVAAYISKREQMPPREIYDGRLYGTAGPLWSYLARGDSLPVVAAAKTQYDIDPEPLRTDSGVGQRVFTRATPMDWNDYREIAAKRLPDLMRSTPLYGRAKTPSSRDEKQEAPVRAYYRPVLNSRRNRWLTKTLRPWEKNWKPKSQR